MLELLFSAALLSTVALSPGTEDAYEAFLARPDTAFFAVSRDGKAWGRSYCEAGDICNAGRLREIAIGHCLVHGEGCEIYAEKPWK